MLFFQHPSLYYLVSIGYAVGPSGDPSVLRKVRHTNLEDPKCYIIQPQYLYY